MSDDLSAFFAKKKDKKKKGVVKIEDVGQVLERKARRQEEYDEQLVQGQEKRNVEDDGKRNTVPEESEWIEYGDVNQGRLEGLRIKDMGMEAEIVEVENNDSDDGRETHETKTWGQLDESKKEKTEPEHAVSMSDKQMAAAYKPPQLRSSRYVPPQHKQAALDMNNDALFPSLADASKIEKNKKDEAKTGGGGWTKAGSSGSDARASSGPRSYGNAVNSTSGSGRDSALAAVKAMTAPSATYSAPTPAPAPAPVQVSAPEAGAPKENKYVPPHLRARN